MEALGLVNEVYTSDKAIAFTFDDGPNPVYTPQVLDIFREASGKATFFMIGEQMNNYLLLEGRFAGLEIGAYDGLHLQFCRDLE